MILFWAHNVTTSS